MQIYESRLPVQIIPFAHPTQREGNIVAASWKKVDENTSRCHVLFSPFYLSNQTHRAI